MRFWTESGSEYEIREGRVRRVNADTDKRGDGQWLDLLNKPTISVGDHAVLFVESLSDRGPDDYGRKLGPIPDETSWTMRTTSMIVGVKP